jgi:hypothetical protein
MNLFTITIKKPRQPIAHIHRIIKFKKLTFSYVICRYSGTLNDKYVTWTSIYIEQSFEN